MKCWEFIYKGERGKNRVMTNGQAKTKSTINCVALSNKD